jgi:putative transposase
VAVSALVNSLKGVSSRLIRRKKISGNSQETLGSGTPLLKLFAGSCGGAPFEIIRQYIEQQQDPTLTCEVTMSKPLKGQY